uniref:Plexin cytoplasmic RasGAP domain-containing protein n=1 Tax=Romanomermis culicivorax TaxID=13658 RepID=A0A915L2D7_ROMCU
MNRFFLDPVPCIRDMFKVLHFLGYINYEDPTQTITGLPNESIFGIAAAILLLMCSIVILLFWYRRKSSFQRNQMKRLKDQIDAIELKVASECKEAFAELQTDMTELTAADVGCSASSSAGIPFLSYRDYAMQVLFPGQTNHPVVKELDIDPKNRPFVDKGLQLFNQLLTNKNFLILMLRTMESNRYFVSQSRVAVGSLLMVIFETFFPFLS